MNHVRETIIELRRYIAASDVQAELEEVDALLAIALEEVRRKLAEQKTLPASDGSVRPDG